MDLGTKMGYVVCSRFTNVLIFKMKAF